MNRKFISAILVGLVLASIPVFALSVTQVGDIDKLATVSGSTVTFPTFVVGKTAATEDVAAAVDAALGMAGGLVTTQNVTIPGTSVETVTGGVKIATPGTLLTLYKNPQDVKGIMTSSDVPGLLDDGQFSASSGTYQYKQYLYLGGDNPNPNMAEVIYDKPTNENTPRISFKVPGNQVLYKYKLTFSTPVSLSGVNSQSSLDQLLHGQAISILGKSFTISSVAYGNNVTPIQDLTLIGGNNVLVLQTNQPQNITVDGKAYTVTLQAVGTQTIGGIQYVTAIGDVDGQIFQLKAGDTTTLIDGTIIAAINIFQSKTGATDFMTLAIGANQVKISASGTVSRGSSSISELTGEITQNANGWSALAITYKPSQDNWMAVGGSLTDAFISAFNIKFNSVSPDFSDTANRQNILFQPSGYNMYVTYKNAAGAEKQSYMILYNSGNFYWASTIFSSLTNSDNLRRDVVFDETQNISAIDQDYFVIQKAGFSHVMQFTSMTPSSKQLTFLDESGNSMTATYDTSMIGHLIVDGTDYKVSIIDETMRVIRVDLNGNTNIASTPGQEYSFLVPKLITSGQGGIYFYNGNKTITANSTGVYAQIGLLGFLLKTDSATAGHV